MNANLKTNLIVLTVIVAGLFSGNLFAQLLVIALLGVQCHYFKGVVSEEITHDINAYFGGAFLNTLASLGGCVLAVFGILQTGISVNSCDITNLLPNASLDDLKALCPQKLTVVTSAMAFSSGFLSNKYLNKAPDVPPNLHENDYVSDVKTTGPGTETQDPLGR